MELKDAVKKTIEVFLNNAQDDETIIKKLIELGIEEPFANRLVNFITTAFCLAVYENTEVDFQYSYFFF